ncbi:precorrin-2 dehydrogenase/sirohydrochlorin ferrochelatase family protein [Poseidonibacter lekithochrous]|uniref:precorrin-2 dehydrogenase/sirohydrochlorin ferrochelatase family protein n=1 Tax=Poseidonibacter lekithochrous TaxID=1904463 RepID=UPI0008FC5DDB|nr:bifunctional precorrin-2 dehydrogenase/sirohydrochlorin ferrochelatase [Poseidonibacter lekithochrous]QKJ21880.1 siroheme synthase [Poseidonibacter lekithochrous]
MSYFPAFINFENKKILIVGAGKIAFSKLTHLLEFSSNIAVLSNDFNTEIENTIKENNLEALKKNYQSSDLDGYDIVIAALDNIEIQKLIYEDSRKQNCLCNCVDLPKLCDFIFPAYIKKGDLTIAISTNGNSPAVSKQLRIYLEKLIPNSITNFLEEMKEYRNTMPKGIERMKFLEQKAKSYFSSLK